MPDDDKIQTACASCGALNRIPRARLKENPRCGRCKQDVFPETPVVTTDASWKREVEDSPLPVLVDFWAEWCGPCRAVAPVVEQIARERKGKLKVVKVNVDQNQWLAAQFQVQSIPMLQLQRGPLFLDKQLGAMPKQMLDAWLDRFI
jgi:thioredoxin 2